MLAGAQGTATSGASIRRLHIAYALTLLEYGLESAHACDKGQKGAWLLKKRKEVKHVIRVRFGKNGYPYVRSSPGAFLTGDMQGKEVKVCGNKKGLLLLARHLTALAHASRTDIRKGFHIHIDDLFISNNDGVSFTLDREDA